MNYADVMFKLFLFSYFYNWHPSPEVDDVEESEVFAIKHLAQKDQAKGSFIIKKIVHKLYCRFDFCQW